MRGIGCFISKNRRQILGALIFFGALCFGGTAFASSVTLSWVASTSTVAGYNIYRSNTSGGPYTKLNTSLLTGTSYADNTVQAGQSYYYVTTAVNSSGVQSIYSNQAHATVTRLLSVSPTTVSFGNVVVGARSMLPVVVTNTGSSSVTVSQGTVTGTGFSVSGPAMPFSLAAGQNTSLTVTFAPSAVGGVTGTLSVLSNASDSPNVASFSATGVAQHSVALTWVASTSANITGYNLYRATVSGGPYTKINSSLVTGSSYTDTTVQAGETYYYVATAVSSQGLQSADSNQATAVVPTP